MFSVGVDIVDRVIVAAAVIPGHDSVRFATVFQLTYPLWLFNVALGVALDGTVACPLNYYRLT